MIKINQCDPISLNKNFSVFSNNTLKGTHKDTTYVVSQLKQYEKQYKKLGIFEVFCEKASAFAAKLGENGQYDFAGIIYSNLVKIPTLQPKQKEIYAKKALTIAITQGDSLHIIARLVDLKRIYKANGNKSQFLNTSFAEEKQLIQVLQNFENIQDNFKTVKRMANSPDTYRLQLANTRVDIGKGLLKNNPETAKRKLLQARKTFEKLGREKEVQFTDNLLSQIQI